jgi:hypothetical protein
LGFVGKIHDLIEERKKQNVIRNIEKALIEFKTEIENICLSSEHGEDFLFSSFGIKKGSKNVWRIPVYETYFDVVVSGKNKADQK